MKKLILLFAFLIPVSIFSEFADGYITVSDVKNGATSLIADDATPKQFIESKLNIKDFEDNSKINITYTFDDNLGSLTEFNCSLKYGETVLSSSSSSSATISFNLEDVYSEMPISSDGNNSFTIKFYYQYDELNVLTNDYDTKIEDFDLEFYYDTVAPDKPSDFSLVSGDKSIHVKWSYPSDSDTEDHASNTIYYQKATDTEFTSQTTTSSSTSYIVDSLENEEEYIFYMTSSDEAGNESEATEQLTAIPVPVDDFYKYYRKNGGKEDGGYCFIATAAYGSYDNGMVKILRSFRDSYLPKSVINIYYKYSPPLANIIANSRVLSFITRIILEPIVIYADFFLYASMLFKSLILLIFSLLLFLKVKVRLGGVYNV